MEVKIDNLIINYDCDGEGENIVLLHGWGANKYTWNDLYSHLTKNYKVYRFDLPGFGESPEPEKSLSITELTEIFHEVFMKLNISSPILLGHSYGGRIVIKYASLYDVQKIILVDSAGIKQKLNFKKKFKIKTYKLLKKLNIKWIKMGSKDYQSATAVMREMIVKAINEDLSPILKDIKSQTLIMWGENDTVTPLKDARTLNDNIKNSGLVIIEKAGHFPYIENKRFFTIVLDSFLSTDINV